jgi:phosphate transport system protein
VPKDLPTSLLDVRRSILSMAALVESRLSRVVDCMVQQDLPAAEAVRHGDREVDQMEVNIEEMCLQVLALQQPVAKDLRLILAVLRVNTELERIGDLSKGIAKRLLHLDGLGYLSLPPIMGQMGEAVRQMMENVLTAFSNDDADVARQVRRDDAMIDDFQKKILEWTQQEMMTNSAATEAAVDMMTIARALERIGDMCTNIAEEIIFLLEGEVVRHKRV